MSVTEYRDRFLQLARYAPADVADDRKKQEHFTEGLEDYLQYALLNLRFGELLSYFVLRFRCIRHFVINVINNIRIRFIMSYS